MITMLNKILWAIATILIILSSIYLSIILKFPQLNIKKMFHHLFTSDSKNQLSSFKLLMMSLAGKIGVGSIAGISVAIYIGGIGSIFWICFISLFASVLTFSETILGILYKNKNNIGGPSYYIKKGLNNKTLGAIYSILILLSYIGCFTGIQTNTITKSLNQYFDIKPLIIGIVISLLVFFIIKKGVNLIASISSKLVPIMLFIYVVAGTFIIVKNYALIPNILVTIIKSAFNFQSFYSGFLTSFIIGMQRGIFATESGIGTGSIASSPSNNKPANEGYIQMIGIYVTSFLICTITAFVIILSNYHQLSFDDLNGIEIIKYSFHYHLGNMGDIIVLVSIILFAFSTILTGYYYGESSLRYFMKKNSKLVIFILQIVTIINLILGCILPSEFIWKLVDILVAILAIINIYAILRLKDDIIIERNK